MTLKFMLISLTIMTLVTYFCRAITLVFVKKQIKNSFIVSFLHYIPYSVLAIMVFPNIFFACGNMISSVVGAVVAILLALSRRSLFIVSVFSIFAVYFVEILMTMI